MMGRLILSLWLEAQSYFSIFCVNMGHLWPITVERPVVWIPAERLATWLLVARALGCSLRHDAPPREMRERLAVIDVR